MRTTTTSSIDPNTGLRKWPSKRSGTDSAELSKLRDTLTQSDHRFASEHLTATRLGIYAGELKRPIRDMGAHSKRWIANFRDGYTLGRSVTRGIIQPLT